MHAKKKKKKIVNLIILSVIDPPREISVWFQLDAGNFLVCLLQSFNSIMKLGTYKKWWVLGKQQRFYIFQVEHINDLEHTQCKGWQ